MWIVEPIGPAVFPPGGTGAGSWTIRRADLQAHAGRAGKHRRRSKPTAREETTAVKTNLLPRISMLGSVMLLVICSVSGLLNQARGQGTADVPTGAPAGEHLHWYKGNLHTHSLWSDGNDFPEMIAAWYKDHGYHFLALSDHNVLSDGQRWMALETVLRRGGEHVVDKYLARFGPQWVERRRDPQTGAEAIRLKPLDEFAPLLNEAGRFLMLQGEEISDRAEGKPVHMNATNLRELIRPVGGATVREAMINNLRQVIEQEQRLQRPILPHINHPNFGYALTAEDLAAVIEEPFFEVYNGHPGVNQLGDEEHPSIERMWDLANAIRCAQLGAPPLMGLGTDDSHEYHGRPGSQPGRGWIMVQSAFLTPEHLLAAIRAGRFYASSGVTLRSIDYDSRSKTLAVEIDARPDTSYTTRFIASLKPDVPGDIPTSDRIGVIMSEQTGTAAKYQLSGDELYVRAVVTSDRDHPNPSFRNQKEQAWTQPVAWSAGDAAE